MSGKVRIVEWTHKGKARRAWGYTATVGGKRIRRAGWGSKAEAHEAMPRGDAPQTPGARAPDHDAQRGVHALQRSPLTQAHSQ